MNAAAGTPPRARVLAGVLLPSASVSVAVRIVPLAAGR